MDKKKFVKANYEWSLKGLEDCIRSNNLKSKIIFANPNGAIVHVVSYDESVILGAKSDWCISQHRCSWEEYVTKPKMVQLFFYCFNNSCNGLKCLYGATFEVKNDKVRTYCCFTVDNRPISKVERARTDGEALFKVVINPVFGNIKELLGEKIVEINNETWVKKEEPRKLQIEEQEKSVREGLHDFVSSFGYYEPIYDSDDYYECGPVFTIDGYDDYID